MSNNQKIQHLENASPANNQR